MAATNADAAGAHGTVKLREWAPVIGVVVAILALSVTVAILASAALGRMEERLHDNIATLRTEAAADKAEVLAQIESVRADVRDVRADVRALRDELAPVSDISAILELLQAR